jgi:hypothetical protein
LRCLLHAETLHAQAARGHDDQARCRLRLGHDRDGAQRGHRGHLSRLSIPRAEFASLETRLPANRLPAGPLGASALRIAPDLLLDLFRNASAVVPVVVCSIRLRISWAVAIGKVLLQLMDARTFVRNHDEIKTGYTKDVHIKYLYLLRSK